MIEITTIAWFGGSLVIFFLCVFIYIIQVKIQRWKTEQLSPLPLEGFLSISNFVAALTGLTIMFTAIFEILTFSPKNSLIAALIIAFTTGFPMWGLVKGLLKEVKAGELKEIVPGEFE